LKVVLAGGVRAEVLHPRTPGRVKAAIRRLIFNLRPGLISSQQAAQPSPSDPARKRSRREAGRGCVTISEAAEIGCGYFITNEKRILKKREALYAVLPPSLSIVRLREFLEILDDYEAGRLV
jgi:hypothetical protein